MFFQYYERVSSISQEGTRKPILLMWALSLWPRSTNDNEVDTNLIQVEQTKRLKLIKEADELFNSNKNREIIALLEDYKVSLGHYLQGYSDDVIILVKYSDDPSKQNNLKIICCKKNN